MNATLFVAELYARGAWQPQMNSLHKSWDVQPGMLSPSRHPALGVSHLQGTGMAPPLEERLMHPEAAGG